MSSRGWTSIWAESISGAAGRVIRFRVSSAAAFRAPLHLGLGWVFFTFLPFLFRFVGRWLRRTENNLHGSSSKSPIPGIG
jgi:hypothetical protein